MDSFSSKLAVGAATLLGTISLATGQDSASSVQNFNEAIGSIPEPIIIETKSNEPTTTE